MHSTPTPVHRAPSARLMTIALALLTLGYVAWYVAMLGWVGSVELRVWSRVAIGVVGFVLVIPFVGLRIHATESNSTLEEELADISRGRRKIGFIANGALVFSAIQAWNGSMPQPNIPAFVGGAGYLILLGLGYWMGYRIVRSGDGTG